MQERRVCSKCGQAFDPDVIFCPRDGTPLGGRKTEVTEDPYVGLVIAGQFAIEQIIGIGAMGRVYRAHQSGIERHVAIKILHRDLLRNPTVIARFHREAKVASRLVHPNVVQVLMSGELEKHNADVGGEAYLVMEYLDGISLRSALGAVGGALPMPRALHVVLQVADAVGEAHAQGIVHRDLKPENVMLVRRGDDGDYVKVLDFGVARVESTDASVATQAGAIFGTARYISPEGARGERVGPASDVYSIATMLFQCLCGQTPFDAESPVAILLKHTSTPAPDVRSNARSSYVPEPIARVIADNLAKDPRERCPDGRQFGRALARAARDSGLSPDDLVFRSTLLGDAGDALQLASMERTKAMTWPGADAASQTMIDEAPAALDGSASAPRAPVSSVEPTVNDEPAPRDSAARAPSTEMAPSASIPPFQTDPSFERRAARERSPFARALFILVCFLIGGALAVLTARMLGAFDRRAPTAQQYVDRANAAVAVNAWDAPPGENVRDITDLALRRFPGSEPVLAVRRDAAQVLIRRARAARDSDAAEAQHLARLAHELDSNNAEAEQLYTQLRSPAATVADQPAPPNDSATPPSTAPRARTRKDEPRAAPAPSAGTPPGASAAPAAAPESGKESGRWL